MDKFAERLAGWFGTTPFILLHVAWFSVWIFLHFLAGFDEAWSILTIIVSLEAIFLALFILRAENIEAQRQDRRLKEDLNATKQILEKIEQTHPHKKK